MSGDEHNNEDPDHCEKPSSNAPLLPPKKTVADLEDSHFKLLYMLSKYARAAESETDEESWIREIPLTVLLYEGVIADALDFDYAPASILVSHEGQSRRLWMNISQEGKSGTDDLREAELVNGLKLSTEDFQPVTAYQVSLKGLEHLETLKEEVMADVDAFMYPPDLPPNERGPKTLLRCDFDGETFTMVNDEGYERESEVNEAEDVSYVSSPWLPSCVRKAESIGGRRAEFTDNAHRAGESATGEANIEADLNEAVSLGNVHALVGEWIPFGANQVVGLNERLGALDRCQGGFFTSLVDENPTDTALSTPPGTTLVNILDFDFVNFINFEAEINYPEDEGVVQVENFGMHLNVDGTIIYGMTIEAIMDRTKESVNVDNLSRLLVDVHQDSSQIMDDLLTGYQKALLDMLFVGDSENRGKYNLLIADEIVPKRPACDYMDRSDRENELKQVLGDITNSVDLSPDDIIIIGREGLLLVGPHAKECDTLLVSYARLLVKEQFIRNYFVRTFILDATLERTTELLNTWKEDPGFVPKIRENLSQASQDFIKMTELLGYLHDSLDAYDPPKAPNKKKYPAQRTLFDTLDLDTMYHDTNFRANDLDKLVDGAKKKLFLLQQRATGINKQTLDSTVAKIESNFRSLVDASAADMRASQSAEIMNIVLAGSFAFHIVDRLTGDDTLGYMGVDAGNNAVHWCNWYLRNTMMVRFPLWFLVNIAWLFLVSWLLLKYMRYLGKLGLEAYSLRIVLNMKCNIPNTRAFVERIGAETIDIQQHANGSYSSLKATWDDEEGRAKGKKKKIKPQKAETGGNKASAKINPQAPADMLAEVNALKAGYNKVAPIEEEEEEDDEEDGSGDESDDDFEMEGGKRIGWGKIKNTSGLTGWRGDAPKISITCDMVEGYILSAFIQWNRRCTPMTNGEITDVFHERMKQLGIYIQEETSTTVSLEGLGV